MPSYLTRDELLSDEQLAAQLQSSAPVLRERAAHEIDRRYRRSLRRFAGARVPEKDVEDIVQETLLVLVGARTERRPGLTNLRAWLFAVAARKVVDYHRAGRRESPLTSGADGDGPELGCVDSTADVPDIVEAREELATLIAGLHSLSPVNRTVIINQHFVGLSRREAAAARGATEGGERIQRSRANAALRAYVSAHGSELA